MTDVISNIKYPRAHFTVILKSFEQLQRELDRISHHLKHSKLWPAGHHRYFSFFQTLNVQRQPFCRQNLRLKSPQSNFPFLSYVQGANSGLQQRRTLASMGRTTVVRVGPCRSLYAHNCCAHGMEYNFMILSSSSCDQKQNMSYLNEFTVVRTDAS